MRSRLPNILFSIYCAKHKRKLLSDRHQGPADVDGSSLPIGLDGLFLPVEVDVELQPAGLILSDWYLNSSHAAVTDRLCIQHLHCLQFYDTVTEASSVFK